MPYKNLDFFYKMDHLYLEENYNLNANIQNNK
jgi:hypothetical protein